MRESKAEDFVNKHPRGFLFVRLLRDRGEVTLLHSLDDGQLYVRKDAIADEGPDSNECRWKMMEREVEYSTLPNGANPCSVLPDQPCFPKVYSYQRIDLPEDRGRRSPLFLKYYNGGHLANIRTNVRH